jgi:hypothetical protein
MSRENVETVRAANDAFLTGDVETALNALDPEVEWHATVGAWTRAASTGGMPR